MTGPTPQNFEVAGIDLGDPASFSPPLTITNAQWGDLSALVAGEHRAAGTLVTHGSALG